MSIDTSAGVENVTWYQDNIEGARRVVVTFPDEEVGDPKGAYGGKAKGMVEMFDPQTQYPMGRLMVDTPTNLEEMAEALMVAARHWKHCIQECDCHEQGTDHEPDGVMIMDLSDLLGATLFPVEAEIAPEHEDHPTEPESGA